MATYDRTIIHQLADQLYAQAAAVERSLTLAGLLIGAVVGGIATAVTGESSIIVVGIVLLAGVGALLGRMAAKGRAFALRAEAQQLLCQAQIEANTRAALEVLNRGAAAST